MIAETGLVPRVRRCVSCFLKFKSTAVEIERNYNESLLQVIENLSESFMLEQQTTSLNGSIATIGRLVNLHWFKTAFPVNNNN